MSNPIVALQQLAQEKRALLEAIKPPSEAPSRYTQPKEANEFSLHWLTWNYLEATLNFELDETLNWRDYAAQAGEYYAREGLQHLTNLVFAGDSKALAALVDIAASATLTLNSLARRAPKRVSPIARQRFFWPILKASKERFGDPHKRLVKDIELGCDAPFDIEAANRLRKTNESMKLAMTLLCRLESWRNKHPAMEYLAVAPSTLAGWKVAAIKLKPFSTFTWNVWFEVAWQSLLAEHLGHPEGDQGLRTLGWYRRNHASNRAGGSTCKTTDSNIQDGIKEKLKQATKRLASARKRKSNK